MNGLMIFPVVSWLRDAHKIVRWNEKPVSFSSNNLRLPTLLIYVHQM